MCAEAQDQTKSGGIGPATALSLAGLVQYAEGSTVSRTIVDKAEGILTLFAFDAGQGLSEHSSPFDAYVVGLDGEAELIIAGEPIKVAPGEIVLMPADVPHAVKTSERFKMMLVMIRA